MKMTSTK